MDISQLYNIKHLTVLAEQYSLRPSKEFGQNYLISQGAIATIVKTAELSTTDVVLEIGPGFGVLTFALLPHVGRVVAFEIEQKLLPYWKGFEGDFDNLSLVWGNATKTVPQFIDNIGPYKVVANVPYQITSQIFRLFLEAEKPPEHMVLMVQKEVAQRVCAKPGDMSLLAVSVQYFGVPKMVKKVPNTAFWPTPRVDSAILSISHITKKSPEQRAAFFRLVKVGFSNKRKQLWHNITHGLGLSGDQVKKVLQDVTGNAKIRAQELSVDQWELLKNRLSSL